MSEITSKQWWEEVKCDDAKLASWLQRQYVGEFAAVHLLAEILLKYGSEMNEQQIQNVARVTHQELQHGVWISKLMAARGISPEENADATRRYWNEVLPSVSDFKTAMQAAHQAEHMRLARIRTIASDEYAPSDIRETFAQILPHEEWHEEVFSEMMGGSYSDNLAAAHKRGLFALSLVLE